MPIVRRSRKFECDLDVKQWRMRQKRQLVPQGQGKKAAQGETPAARKNGANKGTVKGREGESSRLPVNEPMTGTLEHRASRSDYRRNKGRNTRWKELGKERQGEDGRVEKPATSTCCGGLDWPSDS